MEYTTTISFMSVEQVYSKAAIPPFFTAGFKFFRDTNSKTAAKMKVISMHTRIITVSDKTGFLILEARAGAKDNATIDPMIDPHLAPLPYVPSSDVHFGNCRIRIILATTSAPITITFNQSM